MEEAGVEEKLEYVFELPSGPSCVSSENVEISETKVVPSTFASGPPLLKHNEGIVSVNSMMHSTSIPTVEMAVQSQKEALVQRLARASITAGSADKQAVGTTSRTEEVSFTYPDVDILDNGATIESGGRNRGDKLAEQVDCRSLLTPAKNQQPDSAVVRDESLVEKQLGHTIIAPSINAVELASEDKVSTIELQPMDRNNHSATEPDYLLEGGDTNIMQTIINPQKHTSPAGLDLVTEKGVCDRPDTSTLDAEIQVEVNELLSEQIPTRSDGNVVAGPLSSSAAQVLQDGQNSMTSFAFTLGTKRAHDTHLLAHNPDPKPYSSVVANNEVRNAAALSELARKLEGSKSPSLYKSQLIRLPNGDVIPVQAYLQAANSYGTGLQPIRSNASPSEDSSFMIPPQPKRRSGLYPTGTASNHMSSQQLLQVNLRNGLLIGNQYNQGFKAPDRTPICTSSSSFPTSLKILGDDSPITKRMELDIPELNALQNGPPKCTVMEKLTLYERKRKAVVDQDSSVKQKSTEENMLIRYHQVKVIMWIVL